MATRVCEALVHRLRETERSLASADADRAERSDVLEVEVQTEEAATAPTPTAVVPSAGGSFASLLAGYPVLRVAVSRLLLPLNLLRWMGGLPPIDAMVRRLTYGALGGGGGGTAEDGAAVTADAIVGVDTAEAADDNNDADDGDDDDEEDMEMEEELEGEEEEEEEDEEEEEEDDDEDEDETVHLSDSGISAAAASAAAVVAAAAAEGIEGAGQAAEVAAAVASAQASILAALDLPQSLVDQITGWERQQALVEGEWRLKQSRMHQEFEERKRRLQEQQLGQRKKLRESCDAALQPTYDEGISVCAQLERRLVGKLCRLCEHAPRSGVPQAMLPGPLARIRAVSFGQLDSPLRAPNCPPRSYGAVPVASGILVTLEKLTDRNGIAMLPFADDPLGGFSRSGRGSADVKVPLRLLGSKVRLLTAEESEATTSSAADKVFVVRYSGGEHGGPIEPVQILPEGLSLAEYDISFAAGAAALRVEHRTDGPVRCRAEPAAQKQVFSDTPVELYTQEVDPETHNIVQVYFSDLRDEVAVDVLNLTGTETSLDDAECASFPADATGAALNYKIIVRDAAVLAVLYQEGDDVRASPFVEHRLPPQGAFVTLPDRSLGRLGALPRGLVVTRTPQDLPENAPAWPAQPGLRPKGKHPAELPGMVDVALMQRAGEVVWPPLECSVPVCALTAADSTRLRQWHEQWDAFVKERQLHAESLACRLEQLLDQGKAGGGSASAKEVVSELTETYGRLEERQREIAELEADGVDDERLQTLQRNIQRFAALARFS